MQDDPLMQDDHGNRFCGQVVHSPRANIAVQQLLVIVGPGCSGATTPLISGTTGKGPPGLCLPSWRLLVAGPVPDARTDLDMIEIVEEDPE